MRQCVRQCVCCVCCVSCVCCIPGRLRSISSFRAGKSTPRGDGDGMFEMARPACDWPRFERARAIAASKRAVNERKRRPQEEEEEVE